MLDLLPKSANQKPFNKTTKLRNFFFSYVFRTCCIKMTGLSLKLVYIFLTEPNVLWIGETLYLSRGLFLENHMSLSVPKSKSLNCNPDCFQIKSWTLNFNVCKNKRIAKFGGLDPWLFEDIKRIVAPAMGPKSFGPLRNRPQARSVIALDKIQHKYYTFITEDHSSLAIHYPYPK